MIDFPPSGAPGEVRMHPASREARRERLLTVIRAEAIEQRSAPATSRPSGVSNRRRLLMAGCSVVAAGAIGAGGTVVATRAWTHTDGQLSLAVTPPMLHYRLMASVGSAREVLEHLAAVAKVQPDPADHAQVRYTASRAWYLNTRVDGQVVTSRIVPSTEQVWTRADGSGLRISTVAGRQLRIDIPGHQGYDVRHLPADPNAIAHIPYAANTLALGPAGFLEAAKDIWLVEAPSPRAQAAILQLLAAQPGIHLRGDVKDRLGRPGIAICVTSDHSGLPTRYTLILSPSTGMLLGYEEELTTSAGKLNVAVPSVIGYQAWTAATWATEVGQ